jgi:hypothetical protein
MSQRQHKATDGNALRARQNRSLELKLYDDAKIPSAALKCPEKIGVSSWRHGLNAGAVGQNHLRGSQGIARKSAEPRQIPHASAKR